MKFQVLQGDCREVMKSLADCSVDAVVTDPPYELGFMGKSWDRKGIAYDVAVWSECLRVLKPGGHLFAFGGSRTYHRLACAIEDAGFEIRDDIDFWYDANPLFAAFHDSLTAEQQAILHQCAGAPHLSWIYGSGFPKSLDVSKAIDAAAGNARPVVAYGDVGRSSAIQPFSQGEGGATDTRAITAPVSDAAKQWNGWGTALKPAHEPIVVARKPLDGTVAENVLKCGTGGINVDGCRIETREALSAGSRRLGDGIKYGFCEPSTEYEQNANGRWPANVIHDGSDEVLALFPETTSGTFDGNRNSDKFRNTYSVFKGNRSENGYEGNSGSAARFFYCAKADQVDRNEGCEHLERKVADTTHKRPRTELDDPRRAGVTPRKNHHPTVKPTDLMRYLCRLVTPPNGLVLDPFCGSGSTGKAAMLEGLQFIGIELEPEYVELAQLRIEAATRQGLLSFGAA